MTYSNHQKHVFPCTRAREEYQQQLSEKEIEKKFVEAVKKRGGLAPKFVSPGLNGVPDRIVLLKNGVIAFCELKAPGQKMRKLQVRRKEQLEKLGFRVYCIDRVEQIEKVLDEIGGGA